MNKGERGSLLVVTGESGAGKDAVSNELLKRGWKKVVTYTAGREMRPGEVDGVDYYFVSREEFVRMIDEGRMLEWVEYGETLKGTSKEEILKVLEGERMFWRIDPTAAAKAEYLLKQGLDQEAEVVISRMAVVYIKAENTKVLVERALKRDPKTDVKLIEKRIAEDKEVWSRLGDQFKNVVVNLDGRLDETVEKVLMIAE